MLGGLGKQREVVDLVTFGLEETTGTSAGSNGKQCTCTRTSSGAFMHVERAREATGSNGFDIFWAGGDPWEATGSYTHAYAHVLAHLCMLGGLGKQREPMDLVTSGLNPLEQVREALGSNAHAHAHVLAHLCMLGGLRKQLGNRWIW